MIYILYKKTTDRHTKTTKEEIYGIFFEFKNAKLVKDENGIDGYIKEVMSDFIPTGKEKTYYDGVNDE